MLYVIPYLCKSILNTSTIRISESDEMGFPQEDDDRRVTANDDVSELVHIKI